MNTLIAGGAGFIGLNLAEAILRSGGHVVIYDPGTMPGAAQRTFDGLPGTWCHIQESVIDNDALTSTLTEQRIEQVFYGAAITSGPDRERDTPESVLSVNLLGLATVARLAAKTGIRRLINLSSGSAYGLPDDDESDWPPTLREEHTRERPVSLYALSKFATEITTRRIAALTGLNALSVRLSSIFGPWERDTGFRDTLSAPLQASVAAHCGESVILERHESRDWTYSRDVADALLVLMSYQNPKYDLYNITAGRTWSTIDWCKRLAQNFPRFSYRLAEADDIPTIDLYSTTDRPPLDPGRLRDDLGYTLPHDIDIMFADFKRWLAENPDFWAPQLTD